MTDLPKIFVATPVYEAVKPAAFAAHCAMWRHIGASRDKYRTVGAPMGPRVAIRTARNIYVQMAQERKTTHLLFIDDDIVMPPDLIDRLLDVQKPVVGALCYRNDRIPAVFTGNMAGEFPYFDHPKQGAFPVWAVGTGAMLIEMRVFEAMEEPWFYYERNKRTMDVNFCRDVHGARFDVWCSADAAVKQIDHRVVLV